MVNLNNYAIYNTLAIKDDSVLPIILLTVFHVFPEAAVWIELREDPHPGGGSCLEVVTVSGSRYRTSNVTNKF